MWRRTCNYLESTYKAMATPKWRQWHFKLTSRIINRGSSTIRKSSTTFLKFIINSYGNLILSYSSCWKLKHTQKNCLLVTCSEAMARIRSRIRDCICTHVSCSSVSSCISSGFSLPGANSDNISRRTSKFAQHPLCTNALQKSLFY